MVIQQMSCQGTCAKQADVVACTRVECPVTREWGYARESVVIGNAAGGPFRDVLQEEGLALAMFGNGDEEPG